MHDEISGRRLDSLGEFRILSEILFPLAGALGTDPVLGDDCGFISVGGVTLAVSGDVGPAPLLWQLPGHSDDYFAAGWLAAVATASDIATAGATPLFMMDLIDAPGSARTEVLSEYAEGYFAACRRFGFICLGGDLRQGPTLAMRTVGAGIVGNGVQIGRTGVRPDDVFVLLGRGGQFISSFLTIKRLGPGEQGFEKDLDALRFPVPQLRSMEILAKETMVRAASDSSDGVLGAVQNIVSSSGCGVKLECNANMLSEQVLVAARMHGVSPWNLFYFWGDWSVVAVIRREQWENFDRVAHAEGIEYAALGLATGGGPRVSANIDGVVKDVNIVRNENFTADGFNFDVMTHVEKFLSSKIFI